MGVTVVAQKAFTVRAPVQKVAVPRSVVVKASKASLVQEKVIAGVTVGAAAMMASPLAAEAAVTPSLRNLLYSVVAGGVVFGGIIGAITLVSQFDPVNRGK